MRLGGTYTAPSIRICTLCYEINHGTGVLILRCFKDIVVKSRVLVFGQIRNDVLLYLERGRKEGMGRMSEWVGGWV